VSIDQWLDLYEITAQGRSETLARLRELETLFDQDDFTTFVRGRRYRYTRELLPETPFDQPKYPTTKENT